MEKIYSIEVFDWDESQWTNGIYYKSKAAAQKAAMEIFNNLVESAKAKDNQFEEILTENPCRLFAHSVYGLDISVDVTPITVV